MKFFISEQINTKKLSTKDHILMLKADQYRQNIKDKCLYNLERFGKLLLSVPIDSV